MYGRAADDYERTGMPEDSGIPIIRAVSRIIQEAALSYDQSVKSSSSGGIQQDDQHILKEDNK